MLVVAKPFGWITIWPTVPNWPAEFHGDEGTYTNSAGVEQWRVVSWPLPQHSISELPQVKIDPHTIEYDWMGGENWLSW